MDQHQFRLSKFQYCYHPEDWPEYLWIHSNIHALNCYDCTKSRWHCCEQLPEHHDVTFHLWNKQTFFKQLYILLFIETVCTAPVIYKSVETPFKTDPPEPGQTANDLISVLSELLLPMATWTVFIPVCFFTHSIASAKVMGVFESTFAMRPAPMIASAGDGKIISDFVWGMALANQSPIDPRQLSHDVCGE